MITRSQPVTIRLHPAELRAVDEIAARQRLSRGEVIRAAIKFGLPFTGVDHGINVPRLVVCIERMQASLDMIIHREHADAADRLDAIAAQRLGQFHGGP